MFMETSTYLHTQHAASLHLTDKNKQETFEVSTEINVAMIAIHKHQSNNIIGYYVFCMLYVVFCYCFVLVFLKILGHTTVFLAMLAFMNYRIRPPSCVKEKGSAC